MISVSCLDSKFLNNNNWYGRFQLVSFQKGEGLTIANALRRTLLTEKSNFQIDWVDFYNAEIPYSILTGMQESIFDILLNLKQILFTSDLILFVGFTNQRVKGRASNRPKSPHKWSPLPEKKKNYRLYQNFLEPFELKNLTQWIVKTQQRNNIEKKNLSYFSRSFSKLETNSSDQQFMDKILAVTERSKPNSLNFGTEPLLFSEQQQKHEMNTIENANFTLLNNFQPSS